MRGNGAADGDGQQRLTSMEAEIRRLGGVTFRIEVEDNGKWVAESTNVDGIITGGFQYPEDVSDTITDAIFTYFEIPPALCNNALIRQRGDVARVEERVYA